MKTKFNKKILTIALIITLIFSFSCVTTAFAEVTPHISMEIFINEQAYNAADVRVGDEITVKLSTFAMNASAFTGGISFEGSKLECTEITGTNMSDVQDSGITGTDFYMKLAEADALGQLYKKMNDVSTVDEANDEIDSYLGKNKVGFDCYMNTNGLTEEEIAAGLLNSDIQFAGGWQFATVKFTVKDVTGSTSISLYEDTHSYGSDATHTVKSEEYDTINFTVFKTIEEVTVGGITADSTGSGTGPYITVGALTATTGDDEPSIVTPITAPTWKKGEESIVVTETTDSQAVYTATMSLTVTSDTYRFSTDTKINMEGATTKVTDVTNVVNEGDNNDTSTIHFTAAYSIGGVTVSGMVTSYGASDGTVTVRLLKKSDLTEVATTTTTTGTYSLNYIPAGEYVLEVSKANHVTRTQDVTVASAAVTQNVTINMIGDVNEDGAVDIIDMQRLYSHLNGSNPLLSLLMADVNSDHAVDIIDMQRLYSHLNGSNPLFE